MGNEDTKSVSSGDLAGTWTTRQLAEHHGIPLQTVAVAAKRGSIPGAHLVLGRYVFVKEEALKWQPAAKDPLALAEVKSGKGSGPGSGKGFKKGNAFGVGTRGGRPKREFELAFLKTLVDTVAPEDWLEIIIQAVEQAKEGDWRARQWLSNYLIGTPVRRVEIDVDESGKHEFEVGERAAAIMALLEQARERELPGSRVIDALVRDP